MCDYCLSGFCVDHGVLNKNGAMVFIGNLLDGMVNGVYTMDEAKKMLSALHDEMNIHSWDA